MIADTWDVFVGRHEYATVCCRVFEEDIVISSFGEDVYRPLDVPFTADESIDDLLTHAGVEEEGKATGH